MDKKELIGALKDMSDEEILALIRDARKEDSKLHTGYEHLDDNDQYYYIGANGSIHNNDLQDAELTYDCANYYSDVNVAYDCSRADTLMRKLRRFAAEHGGCISPSGPDAWYITYSYPDEAFEVRLCEFESENFTPGMVLFESKKAAEDAIDEFADELYWYFCFYSPMPTDFIYARNRK